MHSLYALAVTALTACAIAHPPVLLDRGNEPQSIEPPIRRTSAGFHYLYPRYLRSQYIPSQDLGRIPYPRPQVPASNWLNKEIDRINQMDEQTLLTPPHKPELPRWITHEPYNRIMFGPVGSYGSRSHLPPYFEYSLLPSKALMTAGTVPRKHPKALYHPLAATTDSQVSLVEQQEQRKIFAFTPSDPGYFRKAEKDSTSHLPAVLEGPHEGGGHEELEEQNPRRQIRQNPISRTKTLVAEDMDKLRDGLDSDAKDKPKYVRVLGSDFTTGTVYAVGIAAGVGTAIILTILGLVFGWYALSKRAKAAADVDYPAYGVTGPTVDTSGDRKLAHSAQMYHYQHQKQQIIAMERNNVEQRSGSVSDPESEEENEEGDYTVYECPGFATTGDMEVKNPLFNEEPTPATPGKIDVVKPQPKE